MQLKQLQAMGALVPRTFYEKTIPIRRPVLKPADEWAERDVPEKTGEFVDDMITIHIRKRSSADFLEMMTAPDRDKAHIAILRCICQPDGTEIFESVEQAKQLEEWLFIPLMLAVNEVNQFGLKNSQPRTSYGAKSRSASADVRSRNGKRRSLKKSAPSGSPTGPSAAA
jgi:hypothetical protein